MTRKEKKQGCQDKEGNQVLVEDIYAGLNRRHMSEKSQKFSGGKKLHNTAEVLYVSVPGTEVQKGVVSGELGGSRGVSGCGALGRTWLPSLSPCC